jgi:Ran GTPase-activating protein (RanGAP) involved in mRNA processing and transport
LLDDPSEALRNVCHSLRANTALQNLNLSCSGFRLDRACATALNLVTMCLQTLHLDSNNVTACGIVKIAEALQGPCTLKELTLKECDLDDAGLLKLGEALTTNNSLEILDVRNNDFTQDGASQFLELLPQMKGLKAVYGLLDTPGGTIPAEAFGLALALVEALKKENTSTRLQQIFTDDDRMAVDSM